MLKKVILLAGILTSIVSVTYAGSSINNLTIKSIGGGWGGEGAYVKVNENITPSEGCSASYFVMPPDIPLFRENLSILLSAYSLDAMVDLYVDGCLNNGMLLKAVKIKR